MVAGFVDHSPHHFGIGIDTAELGGPLTPERSGCKPREIPNRIDYSTADKCF
jgi:hypothetical protein